MSDKSTSDEHPAEENDGEHTVIDSEWGDKFKELEEKYAKDDGEIAEQSAGALTQESRVEPNSDVLLDDDSNAKTALDYHLDCTEEPTLDPAQGPFLPAEPPTVADRPFAKKSLTDVSPSNQVKKSPPSPGFEEAISDELVGPGFSESPSDSFSDVDLGDDWGVTGHAQTGAWGVDETAFLQIDPTSDTEQGIEDVEPPQVQADPFAQVMGRLVCMAPQMDELSFELVIGESSVGRSSECDFTLDEPSVSRLHATLVVESDRVRVLDAGSNNGTFVNGCRVDDEVVLKSHDEISFGTVSTRFLEGDDEMLPQTDESRVQDPEATPPAERVWNTIRTNPYGVPVVISSVLILVTILVALSMVSSRDSDKAADVKPDKVFQYFLDGIEAFKARQWDVAEERFKILKGLDSSHTETLEYLDAVGEERRAENHMKLARTVRKQGHLRAAKEYAQGAVSSIYQQDVALELIASIELEVDARLARARVSLEAGQFGESTRLLRELDKQYPARSDVRALLAFVRGLEGEQKTEDSGRPQAGFPGAARRDAAEQAAIPVVITGAQDLFLEGKLDAALELLEQDGTQLDAHMLAAQLHKFKNLQKVARAEHRAKRSISALKALDSLLFLERQIVSQPSMFRPEIDKKRADMHYLGGVEALGHQRFAVAARRFKRALAAVATYEKASRQLDNLVDRASELAARAQSLQLENPSEARKIWGDVLAMTPDEHPLHRQALIVLKKR